ncbi:unnamed protein product [Heligmosomoides polygyrus]|uniref:Retrotrans_gag domain-containing protein n=1 Tax=Heligmosomoides polygyrus TaxID=6339 RepID=A0A183FJ00_HELPZ|nr:unnamed protein product [Heligmosomoides polygyrus]
MWVDAAQQNSLLEDEGLSEAFESMFSASDPASTPLPQVLQELDDTATGLGRDAKRLRDSTVDAISDVRVEARSTVERVVQGSRRPNTDGSYRGNRGTLWIDPQDPIFFGTADGLQFSAWLRRFDDIARTRVIPVTSEQKANLLVAYLEGVAREKIEELSKEECRSFDAVVTHLRSFFEGPHHRYMARQTLSSCRQEATEPSVIFANRLQGLVRAATAGQDPAVQKERVLEEFVARHRPDIRYFVKLDNLSSFEQAVNRAQTVEQPLAEATADRLINPTARTMADVSASMRHDQAPTYGTPAERGTQTPTRGHHGAPSTETFVQCETTPQQQDLMLLDQRPDLQECSLLVQPAVFPSGECRLLVTNPTKQAQILYKGQAIGYATPVSPVPVVSLSMQQPPDAQSSHPCHDVAADQRVEETKTQGNHMDASESNRNAEHSSRSQIVQQDFHYHDVVAEHPSSSTQCHAVTTGKTTSVADQKGSSDNLYALELSTSAPSRDEQPMSEDTLLASDAEMLSLSNKDSERGSSILDSSSISESPRVSLSEPGPRPQHQYPSTSVRRPGQTILLPSERSVSRTIWKPPILRLGPSHKVAHHKPGTLNEKHSTPARPLLLRFVVPRDALPADMVLNRTPSGAFPPGRSLALRVRPTHHPEAAELDVASFADLHRPPLATMPMLASLLSVPLPSRDAEEIVPCTIPFVELPTLADAVRFRDATGDMLHRTLDGLMVLLPMPPQKEIAPRGVRSSTLVPEPFHGIRPVLYQVVAIMNNHLILGAKDFFVFMPDRLEPHCIQLDKFAFNVENRTYGQHWLPYHLQHHLSCARIQRTSATNSDAAFFFRAHRFPFVTPPVWSGTRFGFVLSIPKREGFVNNFLMTSEDSSEAVTVSSSIARFKIRKVQDGDLLPVNTRIRASCAVRFSEPAASIEARDTLCQAVKMFLLANPDEAMQPMDVAKLLPEDEEWIADRLGTFDNYIHDQRRSVRLMGQLFNAAASALPAYSSLEDDLSTHRVTATIPNLDSYPLRLRFQLSDMISEAGWMKHRHVGVWVPGTTHFLLLKTEAVEQDWAGRCLNITLQTFPWNGGSLIRAVSAQGAVNEDTRTASILVCVRLEKASASTIPAYEAVSRMDLLDNVPLETSAGCLIFDRVYGATPLTTARNAEG